MSSTLTSNSLSTVFEVLGTKMKFIGESGQKLEQIDN
jgi:hypothetical protein